MLKKSFRGIGAGCVLMLVASTALAQWQWLDESGKKVYSDRPPPITVPEGNILKMPRGASLPNAGGGAGSVAPVNADAAASAIESGSSQEDAELKARAEQLKAQQEQKEAQLSEESAAIEQRNAEIEKNNAVTRQRNCERARTRLTQLEPGKRVMSTDASGNVGFMSDETRETERQSVQSMIRANCT